MWSPFPALTSQQNLLLLSSAGATIEQDLQNANAVGLTNHRNDLDKNRPVRARTDIAGLLSPQKYFIGISILSRPVAVFRRTYVNLQNVQEAVEIREKVCVRQLEFGGNRQDQRHA